MLESEYLLAVTEQIRYKGAKEIVKKELSQHIEDQKNHYIKYGLNVKEAEQKAIEQMGDPIAVGSEMDRIHRPQTDLRTFYFICLLSIGGSFLFQYGSDLGLGVGFNIIAYIRLLLFGCFI